MSPRKKTAAAAKTAAAERKKLGAAQKGVDAKKKKLAAAQKASGASRKSLGGAAKSPAGARRKPVVARKASAAARKNVTSPGDASESEAPAEAVARSPRAREGSPQRAVNGAALAQPFPATNYQLVERVLVGFVRAEVTRIGLDRVVLGLSGGVDSSCAAALAARALGPEQVLGVMMPYSSSSPASARDAAAVADALGIKTKTVEITPQIDLYFSAFPGASKERRGNKMARERMTILYDLSAAERALVLGTSNKTELLLGYGTVYGDMASALNPLGDLYKTQVWGLAEHLGVPRRIVEKAPSADLWEGQTDEHELGFGYLEVDALLYRTVDERWTDAELVAAGFAAELVARVRSMVRSSQFKRRLPLIAKISTRTIDADFRYPRDWGT